MRELFLSEAAGLTLVSSAYWEILSLIKNFPLMPISCLNFYLWKLYK